MRSKLSTWGNSLGLRIPKPFALELGLEPGATVELGLDAGRLVVTPVASEPTLAELLAGITNENLHGEIDTGHPRGDEVW